MDEVLARVQDAAETQHSVISTDQMTACGASSTWITRCATKGVIVRIGPSVFRIGGVRPTFEGRAMAAVLSARGPALVSHRSAAYLHGFERVPGPLSVEITRAAAPAAAGPDRDPGP